MFTRIFFSLFIVASACGAEPEKLSKLRENYDAAIGRATAPIQRAYVTELERLKTEFTKAGNLESAIAVDQEIKRFPAATTKQTPTVNSVPQVPSAKDPQIVKIVLTSDPTQGISAQRNEAVKLSKQPSKFRMVPGLAEPSSISFEMVGAKGFFLRHAGTNVWLHEAPTSQAQLFRGDATFRLAKINDASVRIQCHNFEGWLAVKSSGELQPTKRPETGPFTFVIKPQ